MNTRLRREKENRNQLKIVQWFKIIILLVIVAFVFSISYFISIIPSDVIYSKLYTNEKLHSLVEKLIPYNLKLEYGENVIENKERIVESNRYSKGQATYTVSPNAQIEFVFRGTAVEWVGFNGMHNGKADIFLNGEFVNSVDLYSEEVLEQESIYKSKVLPDNEHVLLITTSKERNEHSKGSVIGVDHFNQWDKEGQMEQIDDNDPSIHYKNSNQLFYLQFIIRKLVHIIVYFIITSLLIAVVLLLGLKLKWVILTPVVSFGLAIFDEYRQMFVADRDGSITDILIDCIGILVAFILFLVLLFIKKVTKSKRSASRWSTYEKN